jgi:hypothetical protein
MKSGRLSSLSSGQVVVARLAALLVTAMGGAALGPITIPRAAADQVIGWGDNFYRQISPWSGLNDVVAIAAGDNHSLALRPDGTVVGWGNDACGKASGSHMVGQFAIAAGSSDSLSLGGAGYVNGWGCDYNGSVLPPTIYDVVAIAPYLALRADGSVLDLGTQTLRWF